MQSPFLIHRIEHWPIDKLPYPKNARFHSDAQIAQIAASILEFGFVSAVLIGPDNQIVNGHARVAAARMVGLKRKRAARSVQKADRRRKPI